MILTLSETKPEAGDAASFIFEPGQALEWKAGQYLHYTLPHDNPDSRKDERYFTIASAPFEKRVMITTRIVEKASSFKRALKALAIGGQIRADGPFGEFTDDDPEAEFVFISGGIGITPYRSILLDLDRRGLPIKGLLMYANSTDNAVFREELESLAGRHPDFRIAYFIGDRRIDEAAVRAAVPDLGRPFFYASGPEPMVQAMEKMLLGMGVPDGRFKRDFFPGYDWP